MINNNNDDLNIMNSLRANLNNKINYTPTSYTYNGKQFLDLGEYNKNININDLAKQYGVDSSNIKNINGRLIISKDQSWLQQHGSELFNGINAAVGLGQLGLGIAQYGMAKKYYNAQTDLLHEKLNEAKSEYARIQKLRKTIAAKYSK